MSFACHRTRRSTPPFARSEVIDKACHLGGGGDLLLAGAPGFLGHLDVVSVGKSWGKPLQDDWLRCCVRLHPLTEVVQTIR